jgi:hypothetical protein
MLTVRRRTGGEGLCLVIVAEDRQIQGQWTRHKRMMEYNELPKLSRYSDGTWASLLLFDSRQGQNLFSSLLYNRYRRFLGGKADHSPTSSAQVKNGGAIPSLRHTSSWPDAQLMNHRDNFTFKRTVK